MLNVFNNEYEGVRDRSKVERPTVDLIDVMVAMAQVSSRSADPIGDAINQAEDAACVIFVVQQTPSGPKQWTGSGFLVPGNYIITAEHVLPKAENGEAEIQVSFDAETMHVATIVRGDADVDVGLLHCPEEIPMQPVLVTADPVTSGDIIAVIGAPEGWANVVTVGRVSATEMTPPAPPDPSWTDMLFIDAHILEGSSGSMVIDITGRVVGMVMGVIGQRALDTGVGQNAVVPAHRILRAIETSEPPV